MKAWLRRTAGAVERRLYKPRVPDQALLKQANGHSWYVPPSVLDPLAFRTGVLLAKTVRAAASNKTVLDLGCGSGIVSVLAASKAHRSFASDLNPAAVRAARVNAMLNHVHVEVRQGDLFAPWPEHCFDIVAFNPPFFERKQGGLLEMALCDAPKLPILVRFLSELHQRLQPKGTAYIAGSTAGALATMRTAFETAGWRWQTVAQRERLSERLVVDALRRPS